MTFSFRFISFALFGGAIYSIFDAGMVISQNGLSFTFADQIVLIVVSLLLSGLVVFACFGLFPLQKWPEGQRKMTAFFLPIFVLATLSLCERIFRDPPPFVPVALHSFIGVPLVLLGSGLLFWGLMKWTQNPKQKSAVVLLMVFVMAGSMTSQRPPKIIKGDSVVNAPNVIVISMDTTRFDHFMSNGKSDIVTPHFDALAQKGVRFEKAYAPIAVTGPSHFSLLSGQGPWTHGLLLNGRPLPEGPVMAAEQFSALGYRTGAFVSAPVLDGSLGFRRGFDVYDDHFDWVVGFSETLWGRLWSGLQRRKDPHHVLERRAQRTMDKALKWLQQPQEKAMPFFAWIHLFDPHGPYQPPPPWDTQYYEGGDPYDPTQVSMQQVDGVAAYLQDDLRGVTDVRWPLSQYAGEISYADAQIGRLLDWIDELQLSENTLIVVSGDHGESLGEGNVWFNHGGQLNDAELHIPLVMSWPSILPEGTVMESFVEISDILPTIFDAIAQKTPDTIEGRSFMNAIYTNQHRAYARGICYDRDANLAQRSIDPSFKPTFRMSALQTANGTWTYREQNQSIEGPENTELSSDLDAILRQTLVMDAQTLSDINPDVDEQTRQQLEALGYME